jgi:hypothetical protein
LGGPDSVQKANSFAQKINYFFLESEEFFLNSQVESKKYFADSLNKFVYRTKQENVVLHLDVGQFNQQWQIVLFALRPILKSVFVNETFKKKNQKFFGNFAFGGKVLEYSSVGADMYSLFFEKYSNKFIVYDKSLPSGFDQFCTKYNFVVLDCETILEILKHYMDYQFIEHTPEGTGS